MAEWQGRDQVRLRAGLVLMIYDGLTGKPVESGSLIVKGDQPFSVQKKSGGILVFLNLPRGPFGFCLESPIYEPVRFEIQPESGRCVVKKYYLNPGLFYPVKSGIMEFFGTAEPGTMVYAAAEGGRRRLRLLKDSQAGDEILWIYSSGGEDLSGRLVCLCSPEGEEWVRLGEGLLEASGYRLKTPLSKNHKKASARIFLIYSGRSGENGHYRVLLPEEEGHILAWNQGLNGDWKRQETEETTWDFVCAEGRL